MKNCQVCQKGLRSDNISGFCKPCYKQDKDRLKVDKWLRTGDTSCGVKTTLRNAVRDYLYNDQNNECVICGINRTWNSKPLNFVLDHIDGDASNNNRNNLRLVCHNCDSQLDTYKSKNKNSARSHR